MKKTSKSPPNVWSKVAGKNNVLEEMKNGKKTGRTAELVKFEVTKANKMDEINEYIEKHHNSTVVMFDGESFEMNLYKIR